MSFYPGPVVITEKPATRKVTRRRVRHLLKMGAVAFGDASNVKGNTAYALQRMRGKRK